VSRIVRTRAYACSMESNTNIHAITPKWNEDGESESEREREGKENEVKFKLNAFFPKLLPIAENMVYDTHSYREDKKTATIYHIQKVFVRRESSALFIFPRSRS
jgi:hypothetical protein